jgi:hypothetical protein
MVYGTFSRKKSGYFSRAFSRKPKSKSEVDRFFDEWLVSTEMRRDLPVQCGEGGGMI